MALLPWAGLGVFVGAIAGGVALAGVRGLSAWRTFRSFEGRLERAMADTTRLLDGIEPRVARATETAAKLEEARARLQESIATAAVLFAALGEARALVRRVSAFVPR